MIIVTHRDGSTRAIERDDLPLSLTNSNVTSISVLGNSMRVDVPVPRRFRGCSYGLSEITSREGVPTAVKVVVTGEDDVLTVTVGMRCRDPRVRVDLDRVGRQRWCARNS